MSLTGCGKPSSDSGGGGSGTPAAIDLGNGFMRLAGGSMTLGGGDESTQTNIILSPFAIAKHLTTQADYKAIMGTEPSSFNVGVDAASRPVERISWYEAVKYTMYKTIASNDISPAVRTDLNAMKDAWIDNNFNKSMEYIEYALVNRGCYRLPTEAEFEYALRGGTNTVYIWGDVFDQAEANKYGWSDNNSGHNYGGSMITTTHPVGRLQANGYGLYDVLGNAHTWCIDAHTGNSDTMNLKLGNSSSNRVYRGGSHPNNAIDAFMSVRRNGFVVSNRIHNIGILLVRTL